TQIDQISLDGGLAGRRLALRKRFHRTHGTPCWLIGSHRAGFARFSRPPAAKARGTIARPCSAADRSGGGAVGTALVRHPGDRRCAARLNTRRTRASRTSAADAVRESRVYCMAAMQGWPVNVLKKNEALCWLVERRYSHQIALGGMERTLA